jgi:hypothetical protein
MGNVATVWAPVVSAGVALVSAIAAAVSWWRSRAARDEAARQANIASDSAASAATSLKQLVDVHASRDERQRAREAIAERDPWIPQRDGNELSFFNDSPTAKYAVNVQLCANDQPWTQATATFVGPKRSLEVGYTAISAEIRAEITWHLREDCSDEPQSQSIQW